MASNSNASIQRIENEVEDDESRSDRTSIFVLCLLYCLQGIPLGVSWAIPIVLASRNVSYSDQAEYSIAGWPFCFKLIWAPLLDSVYFSKFGRRKSWLIPTQYCIGLTMLYMSYYVDEWMDTSNGRKIEITKLSIGFFILNFLSATQDIAVDGWALTMLSRKNIGQASTCNSVGQTGGYFLGFALLVALESPTFSNSYLRSEPKPYGIMTIAQFLFYWSFLYILTTTAIAVFKKEAYTPAGKFNTKKTYICLIRMLKLTPIRWLAFILLTVNFANAPVYSLMNLKLIEAGIEREKVALISVPLIPFNMFLLFLIARWAAGSNPFLKYMYALYLYLVYNIFTGIFVWYTPKLIEDGLPMYYWGLLLFNVFCADMLYLGGFTSIVAFFAQISDPKVGATYMTFLNTILNLGTSWPMTFSLWLVDRITWKTCERNLTLITTTVSPSVYQTPIFNGSHLKCANEEEVKSCQNVGGMCRTIIDGFFLEIAFALIFGIAWMLILRNKFHHLQKLKLEDWMLPAEYVEVPLESCEVDDNEIKKSIEKTSKAEVQK